MPTAVLAPVTTLGAQGYQGPRDCLGPPPTHQEWGAGPRGASMVEGPSTSSNTGGQDITPHPPGPPGPRYSTQWPLGPPSSTQWPQGPHNSTPIMGEGASMGGLRGPTTLLPPSKGARGAPTVGPLALQVCRWSSDSATSPY